MNDSSKADRAPRTRDYYLGEIAEADYWFIMTQLIEEEGLLICGRPAAEEEGHIHAGGREDWEWIAPLLVMED